MWTRRQFLGGSVTLVCVACAKGEDAVLPPPEAALSPERYAALEALLDALVPGEGGARAAGAAYYVDQLLGAFDVTPPRIYAGGPFSGRHGVPDTKHLLGTTRMGTDPQASVANPFGRLHDLPNVWIADGGLWPTSTGFNPTLTQQALAWRTAEHLATLGDA